MTATWLAEVQPATARVINGAGTKAGTSALEVGTSKAREQPIRNTAANNKSRLSAPVRIARVIISAESPETICEARMMPRRS